MDPATFVGLALAFAGIFVAAILEGANPMGIFLPPPMILVFIGTFGATLAGTTLKDFIGLFTGLPKWLMAKVTPMDDSIATIVKMAEKARREGLLALEDAARGVDDPFLQKGLSMAIDGTDPDEVAEILEAEIAAKRAADKVPAKLLTDMGGYAPTVGIVGTVLSLTHVLGMLDEPEKLGTGIAVALLATLWGVLSANIIWFPMSKRIERISALEVARMQLVVEGILAIQAGANPRVVQAKLSALLPPGAAVDTTGRKAA